MADLIHFLNGKFVSEDEISISPRDLGFARSYAVHDFIVTYNHKLFKVSEHVDRLFTSAEIIGLRIPWSKTDVVTWIQQTLDKNDLDGEKTMRIYITGGVSTSMHQADIPTILIMVSRRVFYPATVYENGVRVTAIEHMRPFPQAKSNFYIAGVKELSKIENEDIVEVIFYNDKQVLEGAGTNVFAVINNELTTTATNIVEGVTRNTILEIAHLPIPVRVRDFTIEELENATEVFLTGSHSEVRGVVQINGKVVGDGKVGNITREILKQYREYVHGISQTYTLTKTR